MLFDFEKPAERDFTETILTSAGLSLFIVADTSNPRSSPLELQAIMPNYMVPFVPIIDEREQPFVIFKRFENEVRRLGLGSAGVQFRRDSATGIRQGHFCARTQEVAHLGRQVGEGSAHSPPAL